VGDEVRGIKLTQGKVAIVDDEDYEDLSKYPWRYNKKLGYAMGHVTIDEKDKTVYMHRFITNAPRNVMVDHENRNKLDNRKSNLRVATGSQNQCNRELPKNNKSGYKGVSFNLSKQRWRAYIRFNKKCKMLGSFNTAEEAALAYDQAARHLHGDFAFLNFPEIP
jgi:hypothetical protein